MPGPKEPAGEQRRAAEEPGTRQRRLYRSTKPVAGRDVAADDRADTLQGRPERGCEVARLPVRSPRANSFAELWIGTARQECLDHLLTFGRRQEKVLEESYVMPSQEQEQEMRELNEAW